MNSETDVQQYVINALEWYYGRLAQTARGTQLPGGGAYVRESAGERAPAVAAGARQRVLS